MVMTKGIGANLTNDEKRAHLADIRREHLVDQVCIQEILPPEKQHARRGCPMLKRVALPSVICFSTCAVALSANAACIDLKQTNSFSFEGGLSYGIFAGPPNY
jgi:hypothetical protein